MLKTRRAAAILGIPIFVVLAFAAIAVIIIFFVLAFTNPSLAGLLVVMVIAIAAAYIYSKLPRRMRL